ncbi:MAG: SirB2 family protein [Gammaproteobacteria bacterium]|nr:SirB2 family protein [Gammaproteobacteria bacterium]MBU1732072.1 SirB2 family protein [Gammaproteobacteria bacterium]MBU1894113.1 SirB2 family protein [Gammaproteobacteria bacterium]
MLYLVLKYIHVSCVVLTINLFLLRGFWMLQGSARLQQRWVRILPHVIDATLLTSAILLALQIGQYPGVNGWLTAKVTALLLYIGLGTVAIKRGRSKRVRVAAWLGAILVFGYIVAVALTRVVLPWQS